MLPDGIALNARFWGMLIVIAWAELFLGLLPISPSAWYLTAPQLTLAVILAWVLRRPEFVPPLLIVLLLLIFDFLRGAPPGLWTLLVLIALIALRSRLDDFREGLFLVEWGVVALVILSIFMIYRLTLGIFLLPQPGGTVSLLQALGTIVIYPLVTFLSERLFGVTRLSPSDIGRKGIR